MTYTAQNIANIIKMGALEDYIAADRRNLDKLTGAKIVDDGQIITYGYMHGEYGIGYAHSSYGNWSREWTIGSRAYSRQALINHLQEQVAAQIQVFRANLSMLEAARG